MFSACHCKNATHFVFEQIAIGTNDVYKTAEAIKLCGGKIILEPGPLPGINTKIVACLDPDGWKLVLPFNLFACMCFIMCFKTFLTKKFGLHLLVKS